MRDARKPSRQGSAKLVQHRTPRHEVPGLMSKSGAGAHQGEARSGAARLPWLVDEIGRLVVRAVLLLVEGLGVKGARRSGNAGQDGQSEESG